jgi:hypothetical protein
VSTFTLELPIVVLTSSYSTYIFNKAIQNTIDKYNKAAAALDPPCPCLEWSKGSHYSFLNEFSLLQDTHQDIREKPWTKPVIHETIRQHLHIQRVKEEITRCNTEVHRLQTAIADEHQLFNEVLEQLRSASSPLYVAMDKYITHHCSINECLLVRISQIHVLEGFSGDASCGERKGSCHVSNVHINLPEAEGDNSDDGDAGDASEGDQVASDIGTLVDYISELAIRP